MTDPTVRGTRPLTLPTQPKKEADPAAKTDNAEKPEAAEKPKDQPAAARDTNATGPLADPNSTKKGTGVLTDPAVAGTQVPPETKAAVEKQVADYKAEADKVAQAMAAADTPEKIEAAQKQAEALKEKFKELHPSAQDQVKSTFDKVMEMNEAAKGVLETFKAHGADNVEKALSYLTDSKKRDELKGQMDKLKDAVGKVSPAAAQKMGDAGNKLIKALGSDKVKEFMAKGNKLEILNKLLGATGVLTSLSSMGSNMKGLVEAWKKGDTKAVNEKLKALMGDVKGVVEGLGKLGGVIGDLMKSMPEKLKKALGPLAAVGDLIVAGKAAFDAFSDAANRTYRSVATAVAGFVEKLGAAVGMIPVPPQLKAIGAGLEWGGWGAGLAASWAPEGFIDQKF